MSFKEFISDPAFQLLSSISLSTIFYYIGIKSGRKTTNEIKYELKISHDRIKQLERLLDKKTKQIFDQQGVQSADQLKTFNSVIDIKEIYTSFFENTIQSDELIIQKFHELRNSGRKQEAANYLEGKKSKIKDSYIIIVLEGLTLIDKGLYDDAIIKFEAAISAGRAEKQLYFFVGQVYFDFKKDYDKSIKCFEQALSFDPTNEKYRISILNCYIQMMQFANAKHLLEELKAENVSDPTFEYYEAIIANAHFQYNQALSKIESAIAAGGVTFEYLSLHALILSNMGKLDEALDECTKALKLEPLDFRNNTLLIKIYTQQNNFYDGVLAGKKFLKQATPDDTFLLYYYYCLNECNLSKEVIDFYENNKSEQDAIKYPNALIEVAKAYRYSSDRVAANKILELLLIYNPKDVHILIEKANYEFNTPPNGNFDKALETVEQILMLDVNMGEAHNLAGLCYLNKREPHKALKSFEDAYRLRPAPFIARNIALAKTHIQLKESNI